MSTKNKTATLYPSSISQPNKNERHPIKKWSFLEVRRGGKSYHLGAASPNDPRYFHAWTNVSELKSGGKAQCGRKSTYHCSHKTYYNIKGYRNTCPIAGCNGTYNTPATLRLHLSDAALSKKGIKSGSKIKKITISFQHRCSGVDTGNGKEYFNWGPNFYGYSTYPKLKVLQLFFTNSNGERISKIVTKNSNGKDFSNPPLSAKFTKAGTITATFTDVTYDELKGGALNIVYGRNLSTNPGNIYISAPKFTIEYDNAKESITGKSDKNNLYTSPITNCQTKITHTITAGYKSNNDWIAIADSPKDLTKNDISIKAPKNVTVTYKSKTGRNLKYEITDKSGLTGTKKITYTIKNTSTSVTLTYDAQKKNKPDIALASQLKYNLSDSEINSQLIIKQGCCESIKIYDNNLNHLTNKIDEITSSDLNYANASNMLSTAKMKSIVKKISLLHCGRHTIHFVRDNEPTADMISIDIDILPRNYEFKFSANCVGQNKTYSQNNNENSFELIQDKNSSSETIYIQRIDKEKPNTTPKFIITENTLKSDKSLNSQPTSATAISNNQTQQVNISKYISGEFYISIKESNANCQVIEDKRNIHIEPYHKQNHDIIYVRGEDSTSFDYEYIVGWEGDEIREPIDVSNIELICQYDDIKICADNMNTTGISQPGGAKIKISNKSKYHKDFKNIKVELNVLRNNEDGIKEVTTDEFFELDGMLLNFVENFNIVNKNILDNVSVVNLSIDEDYEDEENVYIHIKQLEYNKTIVIEIPFICRTEKEIYIQPLIFGEPIKVYPYTSCAGTPFDYITLKTYDSILTSMEIIGQRDYLEPNINYNYITGQAENQCPNECFITKNNLTSNWDLDDGGITYRIQNIDSNTISSTSTIIHNDENLIPFGVVYYTTEDREKVKHTDIINTNNYTPNTSNKVYWKTSEQKRYVNVINAIVKCYINFPYTEEQCIIGRTDSNGDVSFFITIPDHAETSYTISSLISNAVCFIYEGNAINKQCVVGRLNNTIVNYVQKQTIDKQKRIDELTSVQSQLDSSSTQYQNITNAINALTNDNRNQVYMLEINDYKRYKPGETVKLTMHLESEIKYLANDIIFNPDIQNPGDVDELTVFYKVCNLEDNTGILNTEFKTNNYNLINNKIDKNIYFGVDTQLESKVSIEKRIVEQNTLNVIHVYLFNNIRDNKDIRCIIDLGIYPNEDLFGSYDFVNINIEDGDYNLISVDEQYTENNNIVDYQHLYIEWNIGEMIADTQTNATIILKGNDIGLSEILVDTYDYLHDGTSHTYHFGEYLCNCRD